MNKYLRRFSTFFIFALALASPQLVCASDEFFPFENLLLELKEKVIDQVIVDRIVNGESLTDVALIHTEWRALVNSSVRPWHPGWKAYLGVTPANEQIYRTFFNATLECRHNRADKDPAYVLPFLPLMNLSVKAFDLPSDIKASKNLVITHNTQRFFEVGGSKTHILIATKAMIAAGMKSMLMSVELKAKLDEVMTQWDKTVAPIGIFWRYSNSEDLTWFAYLITQDLSSISSINLYENWKKSVRRRGAGASEYGVEFHVCFEPTIALLTIAAGEYLGAWCPA
jgi:hypothetical protein